MGQQKEGQKAVASEVVLPAIVETPGGAPNAPAQAKWDPNKLQLTVTYHGQALLAGRVNAPADTGVTFAEKIVGDKDSGDKGSGTGAIEQTLTIQCDGPMHFEATVATSEESLAAETRGAAQARFPMVRTTSGASFNRRNNTIYDRKWDWSLAGPDESTTIEPVSLTQYKLSITGKTITLTFKPRLYQKHKNIPYFTPWTYKVRQDSITGWSSWWAYFNHFNHKNLDDLLKVWQDKKMADYGYRFIQIDDCYQGGEHDKHRLLKKNGYEGGHPETWMVWRKDLFPDGMDGYVKGVRSAGFMPGVWMGCFFGDLDIVDKHPDWFARNKDGKPYKGPWIGYAMDTTNPQVVEQMIRPTFKRFHEAGFDYVKIDQLRHYLYDNLNMNAQQLAERGIRPDTIFRKYLETARTELGPKTFILSCWGVLPEAIGIADACRIGGDGYGPVTMQQYNSWNGIVWRNDPDHCDISPRKKGAAGANVTETQQAQATQRDTIIRPALASIAGCMLMLSDKPDVYANDQTIEGARRSAPVVFSVPGQLYDYDESKSSVLRTMDRANVRGGANANTIDGAQFGPVCQWWLNEIDRPFEHWNVLHRLNWSDKPIDAAEVSMADLGLDPSGSYLVYEFWSKRFVGVVKGKLSLPAIDPMTVHSYAIRALVDHPQVVSTNRHLTQGGVDLVSMKWSDNVLTGKSAVVAGDKYELALHIPAGYTLSKATFNNEPATITPDGEITRVSFTPEKTGEVEWAVTFTGK